VEEIFSVPNHWCFNIGVVLAFMGTLADVVRYARLIEFGTGILAKNPYVAEMYKLAPEGTYIVGPYLKRRIKYKS